MVQSLNKDRLQLQKQMLLLTSFCLRHVAKYEGIREVAKKRKPRLRFRWSQFRDSLTENNFRRMFRMSLADRSYLDLTAL